MNTTLIQNPKSPLAIQTEKLIKEIINWVENAEEIHRDEKVKILEQIDILILKIKEK